MTSLIILAAGSGTRMGLEENKMFLRIGEYSLLQRTVLQVKDMDGIQELIFVVALGEEERVKAELEPLRISKPIRFALGGAERQDSVRSGLQQVNSETHIVLVHDGTRPLATQELYERVIEGAKTKGAVVPSIPIVDTIKQVEDSGAVKQTLPRQELYAVQTPQGFSYALIMEAHEKAFKEGYMGTDDVSLIEALGKPVYIVPGERKNIKVTTPEDRVVVKAYLGIEEPMMRVGFGYDVHRFKEGRPCVLGGVTIESPIGPDGHSDADVLLHAVMDAVLGAAGLRDIGYYFPPEDAAYKGISSMILLERVHSLLKEKGFSAYNIDVMVIAEAPKLKPHVETMKKNISRALELPIDHVSIKATTNEGLGALGRTEGIAAQAVVTICAR